MFLSFQSYSEYKNSNINVVSDTAPYSFIKTSNISRKICIDSIHIKCYNQPSTSEIRIQQKTTAHEYTSLYSFLLSGLLRRARWRSCRAFAGDKLSCISCLAQSTHISIIIKQNQLPKASQTQRIHCRDAMVQLAALSNTAAKVIKRE